MGASWSTWAEEEKANLVNTVASSSRRPNVLIMGKSGVGKSALATTMQTAITEKPGFEVNPSGFFVSGESLNHRLRRHDMFKGFDNVEVAHGRRISYIKGKMPVIYTMPGMINHDDDRIRAMLRAILLGRVPDGDNMIFNWKLSAQDIEAKYGPREDESDYRIDRVVFVQPKIEEYPGNLIECVISICNELDVTILGVMSMYDKTDKDRMCTYSEFAAALGIQGSPRGCEVQLYHGGMAKHGRYELDYRTNYYMLLLWQLLLNERYPIHSTNK